MILKDKNYVDTRTVTLERVLVTGLSVFEILRDRTIKVKLHPVEHELFISPVFTGCSE